MLSSLRVPCAMKNDGRAYLVEGFGEFRAPLHIVRLDFVDKDQHGWQARPPGIESIFISDGTPRDPAFALERAKNYILSNGMPLRTRRNLPKKENGYKKNSTGVVGVFFQRRERVRKGRKTVDYSFLIPRPDKSGPVRTVYIGSESTWKANYDAKLQLAAEIRREFKEEFEKESICH